MDYGNILCAAYGTLNQAGAAADPWLGPRRGFVALAVDNGVGDWTLTLDRDTADINANAGGGQFFAVEQVAATGGVTAPGAHSIEIVTASVNTATPQIRIRVTDVAVPGAIDIVCTIMMWRTFGT